MQVEGAIEDERRKQRRREDNNHWTPEGGDVVKHNLNRKPKELLDLLRSTNPGFRKNVDQVRGVKNKCAMQAGARD